MPTRRSTRSSKRGAGPGPATPSQRGKGRARKSARLAVMIKPEEIEEEKEEPNPIPEPKIMKSSNNKETSNKTKSSADDFEDITSGNEFEAIDSDPDDVQIVASVTSKSKGTILEDISDCSINDNEPELEDISSEGSDNEDLAISCGSKIKKTKGVKKEMSKTTEKDSLNELQDSDESDKDVVIKAEDLTDDEKVALGKANDEKNKDLQFDDKNKAVDVELVKIDDESSDSVKIIESNVTKIEDSKDLHEDISDEEHDDIYDDFEDDDIPAKLDVNDEKKLLDDEKEQADDAKEQADDEKEQVDDEKEQANDDKDEVDDEKEQADDDNDEVDDEKEQADDDKDEVDDEQLGDDGKLETEELYDEELEDGDEKLEVDDDEDQEDGDELEVQDDEQEDDEKETAQDGDKKIKVVIDDKETKIEDKQNGDENLQVENEDDENCENEEEVDDEEYEEEVEEPEDSSKDDELKLETEDDEIKTDLEKSVIKSSEDDKVKEGNEDLDDDGEDMEEFDEDGDYVEEDDEELLANDNGEEMEADDKDKLKENAEKEDKVVEKADDEDKTKENFEKEDKVVEKTDNEDKTKENSDKNEKPVENKEDKVEITAINDDKLEGDDDEEEWDGEEWDEEDYDEEMEEDENEAVNKDDKKIDDTTIDDKKEKAGDKIKETEFKTKVDTLEDEDEKIKQNVKEIGDKSEGTDDKEKNVVEKSKKSEEKPKEIKIDKITSKDDETMIESTSEKLVVNDSSSNQIESTNYEISQVGKIESEVKKDETKESKLKLKPKLPAKKPAAPKNKPLMKENLAPAKSESSDSKSDDKSKLMTESITKPTLEKSDAKAAAPGSDDKQTTGLKSKGYTIPKLSSRKESITEKSDKSQKAVPPLRKVVKNPKPVIEIKKEDLEIAAKNNIILKAVTVKVKRLPAVDKNGVSIENIEDYTAPKIVDESKDLEQIDLSDGWKIMDEAVGDPASEKKAKEGEAKRPFYKKPYIRGIEKFRPAVIDLLKTIKGTIVGLDYMVEVWKEDGRSPPRYYCAACKTLKVIENLKDHLTSLTHKLEIMRVTSLDCWHRFPSDSPASWPEGYVNLLEEISKSLIQQPLDDKCVILVTSLHWYNLRRREIDERVRRVHHPSISSKMYLPLFEKLPKVENLGDARKKRIASSTDKINALKVKTSPASSGTKKFETSSAKFSSGADKSGSSNAKPNLSKTTNTKKDDIKTARTSATGSKGLSPGKKSVEKTNAKSSKESSTVKKDTKIVDTKKVPIKNESSIQSKDKKPSLGGVGSGQVRGGKTSFSGGNDKSESATKSRRLSSPKRRRSPSPKTHNTNAKSDNKSPRRRSPIRRSSPRRSPINTRRSPPRRSSPIRRSSPQRRISPFQRRVSPFRKMSPLRRSPIRSRLSPRRSPLRRLSPRRSPLRRLTPRRSPLRSRLSPRRSPLRRLSPRISPRRSPLRRSSPRRSPLRRISPRRSPLRRLTPRRSRSPLRRLTPRRSPIRRSSPSRRSPVRITPPRKNSVYGDRSPLRRQRSPSPRYRRGGSPRNRSRSPNFFKARSPLPYKREGNVVVVDDEIMRGTQQQQQPPRMQPIVQIPDFNQRYDLYNQNPMDIRSNVNPTLNYPISTEGSELFTQRGGIFASSAKRKPIISFDEDIVTSSKRNRMDPYQPDPLEMSPPKVNKDKKGGNFWESWHKTHDEEAEAAAAANQALQEEIWTKQRQNWPGVNPDVRGAAGYNRQLLGRDSISVTVFNKSEKPDNLISKSDVGYGDANPSKSTAEEIWRQQVELASSGRPNALSELRRNPNDWIQTPIGTKDKQSYQSSISELMSKKEAYDSSQSSRNLGNLGNFGRPNPTSSLLGEPDIGNWSNPGNPRASSYEGRLGAVAPRHTTDSWLNSDRVSASPGLSSRDANPSSTSSSSRYGMVKTGTSSSVHPLAAAAFSGSGGLEITGGNAASTTGGRRGERNSHQWNASNRSGADASSNISSRVSGVNIQTKSLTQDPWRGSVGNNIMTASSGTSSLMSTPPQQSWRVQQQEAAAPSILSKPPQEDLNAVAQKLNSTLTRILNDYKPTGGLFSHPALKMAQQRPDQGLFRTGPIGDKLSLAQNIALALTNMGMANVPQHELVAILQHLGLLGGGGQGMMPSGNRVMDDLRETVSRFERTFQYHRF